VKDLNTEELIKEKSKELFFALGKLNASTQEIADHAGVKRTLVNYYFGSKQQLFEIVFDEMRQLFKNDLTRILNSEITFYDKVSTLIDIFTTFITTYPFYNLFVIGELNVNLLKRKDIILKYNTPNQLGFIDEIQKEMELGNIPKMDPLNYYINIYSLVSYPIIMRPYFEMVYHMKKMEFDRMFSQRKEEVMSLLFIKK
jgi:TetR/AcrR family transcriptional regulator